MSLSSLLDNQYTCSDPCDIDNDDDDDDVLAAVAETAGV